MGDIEKIYFDMDGVLADFNKGLLEICKIAPKDQAKSSAKDDDIIFESIRKADHFYRRLDIVPGAKEMFDTLFERFGDRCEILTGVPKPKRNIPEASDDKREWVREKLSEKIRVNTVRRADKKKYCKGPEYILIDDYEKNIEEWRKNGGTGILFRDAEQALAEILELIDEGGKEKTMDDKKRIRTISPMSSVNFEDIAAKWNDDFNHGISNPTDQWHLIAYPVMPGEQTTQVALIFEQEIRINEPDCSSLFKYRVLLYDMTVSPVLLNSSEFQFKDWEVYSAWFFDSQLYVVMKDDDARFDVIKICGDGNERVLQLGRFVTEICTTTHGDILVGYDCCDDGNGRREPITFYIRNGDSRSLEADGAITCEAACIDSYDHIWAYVRPYEYICHMEGEKYETFPISLTGFSGIGVSDDGRVLLGTMSHRYFGTRIFAFRRDEDDIFRDEIEIILDTGEDEKDEKIVAVSFAGNKAVLRKGNKLHMININELTWNEAEIKEVGKKDHKKSKEE